jgi:hypothetical protein
MTGPDDALDSLPPLPIPEGPSAATSDAIRKAVHDDMCPVKRRSLGHRMFFVLAAGLATGVLVVVSFGGFGLTGVSRHVAATIVCSLLAGLAALALGGSFTPRIQALPPKSTRMLLLATLVVTWSLYLVAGVADQALATALSASSVGCGLRSTLAGAIGAAAFLWIWRKTDPWTPRLSGALIGACAGAIASAGVGIPCPPAHGGHMVVGHWLAVPVLALLGALVAPRVLSP